MAILGWRGAEEYCVRMGCGGWVGAAGRGCKASMLRDGGARLYDLMESIGEGEDRVGAGRRGNLEIGLLKKARG